MEQLTARINLGKERRRLSEKIKEKVEYGLQYTKPALKLIEQLKNIEDDIRKAEDELTASIQQKSQQEAVRAFVIFDNCLDKDIFLWAYANNPFREGLVGKLIGNKTWRAKLCGRGFVMLEDGRRWLLVPVEY